MIKFYHVVPLGVYIPECGKQPVHCFRLQSMQSDCNLSNQTAILAIRLQSQQSDCNLSNQTAISAIRIKVPDTLWRVGACICKLRNFCNLSNQTAISAIRLQSQQSDCNPPALQSDCVDCSWIADGLWR